MSHDLAVTAATCSIPSYWRLEPLGRHLTLRAEANSGSAMPLLSLSSTGAVSPRSIEGGLGKQAPSVETIEKYWIAQPGDLVVNPMWLAGGGIGVSRITGAVSPDYRVYKLDRDLNPLFIHHLLRSAPYLEQYRLYMRAETTFDRRVSKQDFHCMPIVLPPIIEQARIAAYLDSATGRINDLVLARRRQVRLLSTRYTTAISEVSTPQLVGSDPCNQLWPWLPQTASFARLGYSARVQTGVTVHGARETSADGADYPYLRVANVQGEEIDLTEVKRISIPRDMARRATLQPGDVVMTEANGNPDNLGRGAVWRGEIPNMVHQNHIFAIRTNRSKLRPEYLSILLASNHGRRYFRFTSNQVGIATTSSSKVLSFPIPLLELNTQAEIISGCREIRQSTKDATDVLVRQLDLLTERRQALITAAVTGQFDVSAANGRGVTE